MAVSQRWKRSLTDVKVTRGTDVGSDHHLLLGEMKLKLKKANKNSTEQLFDSQRLRNPNVKDQFAVELRNRYDIMKAIPVDDLSEQLYKIQEAFVETSKTTPGHRKKERKDWISDDTWNLIEGKKGKKQQLLACKAVDRDTLSQEYREMNIYIQVKKSIRRDKRTYVDILGKEAHAGGRR